MSVALTVPRLAAGPFRLRPFALTDVDVVREASADPLIPLITTVPAAFTEDEGRTARGRGAAGFAVVTLARWAHHDLGIPRLQLYVEPWNTASIRTAEAGRFPARGAAAELAAGRRPDPLG